MFILSTFSLIYQLFFLGRVFVTLASAPSNLCVIAKFAEMPPQWFSSWMKSQQQFDRNPSVDHSYVRSVGGPRFSTHLRQLSEDVRVDL